MTNRCISRQVNIMLHAISFFELQLQIIHIDVSSKMVKTFFVKALNSNVDKKFVVTFIIRWEELFDFQSCSQHKRKLTDGMCRKCPSYYYLTMHKVILFTEQHPFVNQEKTIEDEYYCPNSIIVKNILDLLLNKYICLKHCRSS
jgi:hypothetical protein